MSGASRERGYEPCTQDAASRSDFGSSPETPSVSGTRKIVIGRLGMLSRMKFLGHNCRKRWDAI